MFLPLLICQILSVRREDGEKLFTNFGDLFGGAGCLTKPFNKSFDFGADADDDMVPGILTEFLSLRDRDNCCGNFSASAALAQVCGLRMFLAERVICSKFYVVNSKKRRKIRLFFTTELGP